MFTRMVQAPPGNANHSNVTLRNPSPPVTTQTQPHGGRQQCEADQVADDRGKVAPEVAEYMTTVMGMESVSDFVGFFDLTTYQDGV